MADTTVTARVAATMKEAENRVLESLETNTPQVINDSFDSMVASKKLPWCDDGSTVGVSSDDLKRSLEWVDSLQIELSPQFARMTIKEARVHRVAGSGGSR